MSEELEIKKLKQTISELIGRGAEYLRRIEELEQQVFDQHCENCQKCERDE